MRNVTHQYDPVLLVHDNTRRWQLHSLEQFLTITGEVAN